MSGHPERDPGAPHVHHPRPALAPNAAIGSDDRQREIALQMLPRFSAAIRVSRSYESDNQVFIAQLAGVLETVAPLLEDGEAVFVALDSDLFLNGFRVPVRTTNVKFHRHVLDEFAKRLIAGLRITKGATAEELSTFFRLFREPDVYNGADLLRACVANGVDHIVPVVHASTDGPEDAFAYESEWSSRPAAGGPAAAPAGDDWGGGGPGGTYGLGRDPVPPAGPGDGSGGDASAPYAAPRGAARKSYSNAVQGARSLLVNTSLQGGMELRHAKRVVQPLVDDAYSDLPAVVGLGTLSHRDEYTYAHAVNVTLIAVTIGHFLELDRKALADLGVAALLHDVGKHAVGDLVTHPYDAFDEADWEAVRRHPLEGARLIARSTNLNATTLRCMHVALEHHLTASEGSYPDMGERWRPSLLSRIVQVADAFVSLQTHRSERGAAVTPYRALGTMLGPMKGLFDPALLWALVQTVGFYPPGQLVELDDGSIAAVLSPNAADLARPHVRVLVDTAGQRLEGDPVELRPIPPDRAVRRALAAHEYPDDPGVPRAA